jgi:tetratricopeptide (TPR) repeat protein
VSTPDTAKVDLPPSPSAATEAPRTSVPPPAVPARAKIVEPPTVKPAPPRHVATPAGKEITPVPPPAPQNALTEKVAALLAKAETYISNHQYDKAIATGENALVLDPDNASAKALIRRAKAKQLDVLKTGTSLE